MTEPHDITHVPDALRYFAIWWAFPAARPTSSQSTNKWPQDLIDDYRRGTVAERAEMERMYGKPPTY
jgi:hypothetical protein